MYTQTEAKKKWCQFVRALMDNVGAHRTDNDEPIGECIASRCAAWRWSENPGRNFMAVAAYRNRVEEPPRPSSIQTSWEWVPYDADEEPAFWREPEAAWDARREGFCGLAGKP